MQLKDSAHSPLSCYRGSPNEFTTSTRPQQQQNKSKPGKPQWTPASHDEGSGNAAAKVARGTVPSNGCGGLFHMRRVLIHQEAQITSPAIPASSIVPNVQKRKESQVEVGGGQNDLIVKYQICQSDAHFLPRLLSGGRGVSQLSHVWAPKRQSACAAQILSVSSPMTLCLLPHSPPTPTGRCRKGRDQPTYDGRRFHRLVSLKETE